MSDDLSLDDIKPDHSNGSDDNLVTCCRPCNSAKGNRTADFYLAKLGQSSQATLERVKNEMAISEIPKAIAKVHGITLRELLGTSRKRHIVAARAEAIKMLREAGLSLPAIGAILRRDHTTILHHVQKDNVS